MNWRQDAKVMGLVGLAHGTSHFCHLLLSPLFPFFIHDFGLTYTQLGGLMTAFFIVSGTGQALAGFVVDRLGALPSLFTSMLLFIAAALVAAGAQGYGALLCSALLAGLGNASFHPVDFSILNQRVSAPRLGYAMSTHGLLGHFGWALAGVFLVGIAGAAHWRVAYLAAAGLVAVVTAVLFWNRDALRTFRTAPALAQAGEAPSEHALAFLKMPLIWACFGFFFLTTLTLSVVQSFLAPLLRAVHGVSLQTAASVVTAYMLFAAVGVLWGGFLVSRRPHASEKVVALCMACGALLMGLCATGVLSVNLTLATLALTGLAMGIAGPSRDIMVKRVAPAGATGRVYGLVYCGLDAGFAISPLLFGPLMDQKLYSSVLGGAALALLLSVLVVWQVRHAMDRALLVPA